jgi:large subunit ribosomal protein L13
MKTFSAKTHEVKRGWFVIDATDKILGRVASEVARRLRGKHKPEFTPHVDTGDFIVVINAGKLRVTGNKATGKIYYRHSTYPGGIYATSFLKMQQRFPGRGREFHGEFEEWRKTDYRTYAVTLFRWRLLRLHFQNQVLQ